MQCFLAEFCVIEQQDFAVRSFHHRPFYPYFVLMLMVSGGSRNGRRRYKGNVDVQRGQGLFTDHAEVRIVAWRVLSSE